MLKFLSKNFHYLFALLLCFALITRLYNLTEIKGYIFDEVYHALTSKLIARNDKRAYEWNQPQVIEPNTAVDWLHPPYAKYTQALGMKLFGENEFGWRISSVVFGVLVIWITVLLAHEWFGSKPLALLAGFLASLDGLLLVQSRIAMNDIHVAFMMLLTLYFYLKYRKARGNLPTIWQREILHHASFSGDAAKSVETKELSKATPQRAHVFLFLTGVSAGVAMGTKWSGLFVLIIIWMFEILPHLANVITWAFSPTRPKTVAAPKTHREHQTPKKHIVGYAVQALRYGVFLLVIPFIMYIFAYSHMFLQGKTLVCDSANTQIKEGECYCRQESSWWVQRMITMFPSREKQFLAWEGRGDCKRLVSHFSELHNQIWWYQTNLEATHNYQSRPFQWFLNLRPVWMHVTHGDKQISNIYALGNPALFWIGAILIIFSCAYIISLDWKKMLRHPLSHLLIAYFSVWLPWQLSPRIMFFYHYTPAVPLLSIIIAYWLLRVQTWQIMVSAFEVIADDGAQVRSKEKNEQEVLHIGRALLLFTLFTTVFCFILFYPNWTGIPVPIKFAESVYFMLPSWK